MKIGILGYGTVASGLVDIIDNNKDKRFQLYKLHNPTCKVLYEIPDLPEDIEKQESC